MENNWILVFLNQTIRLCQAVKLILVKITSVSMDSVNQGRRREVIGVNVREDTRGNTVTMVSVHYYWYCVLMYN